MIKRITGFYEAINNIQYFIPYPLPPKDPGLILDEETNNLHDAALQQLKKLNEIVQKLPSAKRFIKAYVLKEALLSSAIEGIHTTILDIFTQPLTGICTKDTQLVLNYIKALEVVCAMIAQNKLPIASRVILKAHQELMFVEGDINAANPGHYRQQGVRVGKLIPTYAAKIPDLMAQLAQFINKDNSQPPLIKAGLAHVQFETIHPFLDGNGRIGRLLIVLMFIQSNLLSAPIIYPSYYFKKNRREYYNQLDSVRTEGDFEGWIKYYLIAIKESCIDAYGRIKDIEDLEQEIRRIIASRNELEKMQEDAHRMLDVLFEYPVLTIAQLSKDINIDEDVIGVVIQQFVETGILVIDDSEKQYDTRYIFQRYLDVLESE